MLENHSCFVREGGWQYNLSVNPTVLHPRSPFRLDYGSVCSVWHESVGLIVSGAQDKKRPWHHSFYAKGPDALGVLYGGQIGNLCEPKYLEALYSSNARGRIEVALPRADTMELTVSLSGGPRSRKAFFNVPLRVGVGETVKVAGRSHVLTRRKMALPVGRGGEVTLMGGKVAVRSQAGGRLHFPCLPWNPYSKGNRSTIAQAFLRLEIPLAPRGVATKVRIKVRR